MYMYIEYTLYVINYVCPLYRIVLRNHIAQKAIEMAEKGDYSEVGKIRTAKSHCEWTTYSAGICCIPSK